MLTWKVCVWVYVDACPSYRGMTQYTHLQNVHMSRGVTYRHWEDPRFDREAERYLCALSLGLVKRRRRN